MSTEQRRPRARSGWLVVLRKELVFPILAAVIASVIVLVIQGPGSPFGLSGPQDWTTQGTFEVQGVRSWGQVGVRTDDRLYLSGTVEDTTAKDGRGVELRIETTRRDGSVKTESVANTGGGGKRMPIGESLLPAGGKGMRLDDNATRVRVANCLMPTNKPGSEQCGPYKQIYEAS